MSFSPALLLAILLASSSDSGPAVQAILQTDFNYLASVRTTKSEFWILSQEQAYEKRGEQVRRVVPTVPVIAAKDDIHTLGFDYEPDFRVWKVEDTAESRMINGRTCTVTTAQAATDYSEAQLRFWLCPQADKREAKLNAIVARAVSGRFPTLEREALKVLATRTGMTVLQAESEIEPPIAPRMKFTVQVLSLDTKGIEGHLTIPPEGGSNAR